MRFFLVFLAITIFHLKPNPVWALSEQERIKSHLVLVEELLRSRPVDELNELQLKNRMKNLSKLRQYWEIGQFPTNTQHPGNRQPYFIDAIGVPCAVAYLIIQSGAVKLANRIAIEKNNAYLDEIEDTELSDWVQTSGLSFGELRLIQPTYSKPGTIEYCIGNNLHDECLKILKDSSEKNKNLSSDYLKYAKDSKMVQILLENGVSPNGSFRRDNGWGGSDDLHGGSPLWNVEYKLWLNKNSPAQLGLPLSFAEVSDLEKRGELLKSAGAKFRPEEEFLNAIKTNDLQEVRGVLQRFPQIKKQIKSKKIPNGDGESMRPPLFFAIAYAKAPTIDFLIQQGASVHAVGIYEMTPLHFAAWRGNLDAVKLLIAAGANVRKTRGRYHATALSDAKNWPLVQEEIKKHLNCKPIGLTATSQECN